jgi:protocatechuate 3,4-dioxygenase beta subunit
MIAVVLVATLAFALQGPPPASQTAPTPPGTSATSTPPIRKDGVLRGRVLKADGFPLTRAQLRLSAVEPLRLNRFTTTDDDGRYEFTELVSGEYTITASHAGYITAEYGQQRLSERGERLALEAGRPVEHIDIVLARAGVIAGRIVDELGDPLQGATIRISRTRFVQGHRQLAEVPAAPQVTDDLGRYRVFGLTPGQYLVSATIGQLVLGTRSIEVPGYATTYFPGTPNPAEARFVTVGLSQELPNVDFQMARVRGATVRGHAVSSAGDPIDGGISLLPSEQLGAIAFSVGAHTRRDGSFEFRNVSPGLYVVQVQRSRPNPFTEGEFGAERIAVNGVDVPDLLVRTSSGSRIAGHVILEGGASEPDRGAIDLSTAPLDVDFAPGSGQLAHADIRNDWSFDLNGITGTRRLRLRRLPTGWGLEAIRIDGLDITDKPFTFGTTDQSLMNVDVVLTTRTTEIDAAVTDGRGRPVTDGTVIAFATDNTLWYPQSRFFKAATRATGGLFKIEGLPPGEYFVATVARTFARETAEDWQDPDLLEQLVTRATRISVASGQHASVTLKLP